MAVRLDTIRFNIFANLNDTDREKPAVQGYIADQAISRNMQAEIARLGHPIQWNTSWLSLTAGTSEYTVTPSAGDFHAVGLFRLASTGRLVEKVSAEYFERCREGIASSTGDPVILTILETLEAAGTTRKLTVRIFSAPSKADTLQALVSEFPLPVDEDADGVPLSEIGARALELKTSAELLARMTDEDCARLKISKDVGPIWLTDAQNLLLDEQARTARLRRGRQLNRSIPY